ncbi:MAG: response regulator [Candidatus Latescibacteria bacterium]|jgi:CheY-like chemotaxis protein|nr:response regulator [Candidatus Latescibacterota bacterium]
MSNGGQLIGIEEVAQIFEKSVESIRKYKNYGILKVADKIGNKDLFSRDDVLGKKQIIKEMQVQRGLSLAQIAIELEAMEAQTSDGPEKLLIVEDEEATRETWAEFFQNTGYQIVEAADGQEALDVARAENPDLVLLDLRLPRLDGYQVCQRLKSDPAMSHIPIIMITAFLTGASDTVRGIEYGADDYLNKPVDLDVLAARVKMVLRRVAK